MTRLVKFGAAAVSALAVAVACSKHPPSPSAPSAAERVRAEANSDGSTLKASAPTLQSPINGARLEQGTPVVLVVSNSTATFTPAVELSYRFELTSAAGAVIDNTLVAGGAGSTSRLIDASLLEGEQTYSWRARAEYQGAAGPWSAAQSFVGPPTFGYIRGNELYDPLWNGQTVGRIDGPATWIPNVGLRMDSASTVIEYALPQALIAGEYSALVTGLTNISNTEDPKWRVISMREGQSAMNDNDYRMTVDKRGNGAIAWRFLAGDNRSGRYIETVGAERVRYRFQDHLTYLVGAYWGGGFFRVVYREGGADGITVYDFGKPYGGQYAPSPHMVYAGSPWRPGDRGEPSTVKGMIIRQIWVSPNPRPAFANK
jgi:hypothetical protein